jgi:glycosyltransferase 2 family protein
MKKYLHYIGSLISLTLFIVAVIVIYHKLKQYHYREIVNQIVRTPWFSLFLAFFLTFLNYLVLTGCDILALRYIRASLKYPRIAVASFVGYAFSMNMTILGGSAARYRIYSSLGVSASNVARLVVFYAISFWLGFFAVGAFSFLFYPQSIPEGIKLPFLSVRLLGAVFLILVLVYLILILLAKKPLKIFRWQFQAPSFRVSILQILLSSLDWILAALVLYVLLPHKIEPAFTQFLGIFLLAQTAGLISHVPGGLGVFETIMLLLMSDFNQPAALMGSLLLYRVIYYLLPLVTAMLLLGFHEVELVGWRKYLNCNGRK